MSSSFETQLEQTRFSSLPLAAQLETLESALGAGKDRSLVELCASLRDPAPLAWLSRRLLDRGWLRREDNLAWLAGYLTRLPETSVHKIVRSMTIPDLREEQLDDLRDLLVAALNTVPLQSVGCMCLLDRALRNHFPDQREAYLETVFADCEKVLKQGQQADVDRLAQVSATMIPWLRMAASEAGTGERFEETLEELARQTIAVIGSAPKAISQANAEDLLARRVYTDPGHFLIELLQNAEDAGAKTWRLVFDQDRITVWHDGTAFDVRDVVGVTSIGQTTKRQQQIGFFGVGFKSVYEITDRPQIYSDVWSFEIADVSIPKSLTTRPADFDETGTAVVLPLRPGLDDVRSPKALYEKAKALDPCVLLTLRSIDIIDLRLTERAGGPAQHTLIEGVRDHRSSVRQEPSGDVRSFLIQDDEYIYESDQREAGRPDRTKVMVGVLLDPENGNPVPLEKEAATVYSYLPTRERPGLRFWIQGHFDVPVDRERVSPDSAWNGWVLSQVPVQLSRLAERISIDQDIDQARGFLNVLPLASELPNPPFNQIARHLEDYLSGVAFLPTADGKLAKPEDTLVASAQIVNLFAGVELTEGKFLDPAIDERSSQVALATGARSFTTEHLLAYLEEQLSEIEDGCQSPLAVLNDLERLSVLYDLLVSAAEQMERSNQAELYFEWINRIAGLPVVPDQAGNIYRPGSLFRTTTAQVRDIYKGTRALIHERLDLSEESRTREFFNLLDVKELSLANVVDDLENSLASVESPLADIGDTSFPGSRERLELVLSALTGGAWDLIERAGRLPLFAARDGGFWPVAKSTDDLSGVLRLSSESLSVAIGGFYGNERPIAAVDATVSQPQASLVLLARLNAPVLDLEAFVVDLGREDTLFGDDIDTLRRLHILLESIHESTPEKIFKKMMRLPIWPDTEFVPRPLTGSGSVLIPESERIVELFDSAPFIDSQVGARRHVRGMDAKQIGAAHVVRGLMIDASGQMRIERQPETVEKAMMYVAEHCGDLEHDSRDSIRKSALMLSDEGELVTMDKLSVAESAELRTLYRGSKLRRFVDPESATAKMLRAVNLYGELETVDHVRLIDDLESAISLPIQNDAQGRQAVLCYLDSRVDRMPRKVIERLSSLPIFPDTMGNMGKLALGLSSGSIDADCVYPCDMSIRSVLGATDVRLFDERCQSLAGRILKSATIKDAGLAMLVEALRSDSHRGELSDLDFESIQTYLTKNKRSLARIYPPSDDRRISLTARSSARANPVLQKLLIWKTLSGAVVCADQVVDVGGHKLFDSGMSGEHETVTLAPDAMKRLKKLEPLMVPLSPEGFVAKLMWEEAREGRSLADQPPFLSTLEGVMKVRNVLKRDRDIELPRVNAAGCLTFNSLYRADQTTRQLLAGLPEEKELMDKLFEAAVRRDRSERDSEEFPADRLILAVQQSAQTAELKLFYKWILEHEKDVFYSEKACELLQKCELFPTTRGTMVRPSGLVIDSELPDLGIDWIPSPSIPDKLLEKFYRHLDIGRPDTEDLIRKHVLPAYLEAAAAKDGKRAAQMMIWMAKTLEGRSEKLIKRLIYSRELGKRKIYIEDAVGKWREPKALLIPDLDIATYVRDVFGESAPLPSPLRYDRQHNWFLLALGVRRSPDFEMIRQALKEPVRSIEYSAGIAGLVSFLVEHEGEKTYKKLPLKKRAWVMDGAGTMRTPGKLFMRDAGMESVIGSFDDLYPHAKITEILPEKVSLDLGFRDFSSIEVYDVARHVLARVADKQLMPFQVYLWLDREISEGRLKAPELVELFAGKPWIYTDDREYRTHDRVLGFRGLEVFGERRGYWQWGGQHCKDLIAALGIPDRMSPEVVADFVRQIGAEALESGSGSMIEAEPALPRMLEKALAILGDSGLALKKSLPLIPAVKPDEGVVELVSADYRGLYWSDTPTLERLFASVDAVRLAVRGGPDDRDGLDEFYKLMGIPVLRDSYSVESDADHSQDVSEEYGEKIKALRQSIRALLAVLPRARLQRSQIPEESWVYEERLRPLALSGSILAIEGLRVKYVLNRVGEVSASKPAAYDPDVGELLVDTSVLDSPERTGLAEGMLACVIEGEMGDALVDLLEILLQYHSREEMDAYLDRRHFPTVTSESGSIDRIAQRIGELFDYGLDRRLKEFFPELSEVDLSRWRHREFLGRLEEKSGESLADTASRIAALMVKVLELRQPLAKLTEMLEEMLRAPTLGEASASFARDRAAGEKIKIEVRRDRKKGREDSGGSDRETEKEKDKLDLTPAYEEEEDEASVAETVSSFFSKITSKLGIKKPSLDFDMALPSWAQGNCFSPQEEIGPQLWSSKKNLERIESSSPAAHLLFSPESLPRPYLYAVDRVGVDFDPRSQEWIMSQPDDLRELNQGQESISSVFFEGKLMRGASRLPVPLYGRLASDVKVTGGAIKSLVEDRFGAVLELTGGSAISVSYVVDLFDVPELTAVSEIPSTDRSYLAPTTPFAALPVRVQKWIEKTKKTRKRPLKRALAAQEFVQRNYKYDSGFLDRPEVRAKRSRLVPRSGNHHLELLHASSLGQLLGRGVCYELNVMLVELLRHLEVPAMVATGWILNKGSVDRPSHLFALAIVPSSQGASLLPLDAASSEEGPITVISTSRHRGRPSQTRRPVAGSGGAWEAPAVATIGSSFKRERRRKPDRSASGASGSGGAGTEIGAGRKSGRSVDWQNTTGKGATPGGFRLPSMKKVKDSASDLASKREKQRAEKRKREMLVEAINCYCQAADVPKPNLPGSLVELRKVANKLYGKPSHVATFIQLLKGELTKVDRLDDDLKALERIGLIKVERVSTFKLRTTRGKKFRD